MSKLRWLSIFAVLFLTLSTTAQDNTARTDKADEAAREKQRRQAILAESIITESRELRLAENRALIFAKLGGRLWDLDRKRAEDLFQDAVTELLAGQAEAEQDRLRGRQNDLLTGQNIRPQVLQAIAHRDADLALRSLYRTRPLAVERAITGVSPKDTKIRNSGNDSYLAQNELHLEQSLMRLAADRNPEKAVALLRAALKKGITGEALSLLQKLHDKDPSAAADIGSELTSQLLKKNLMNGSQVDYPSMQAAFSFLGDHVRQRAVSEKGFRFDAAEMRSLADKMITFFLDRANLAAAANAQQMVPIAEKMRPDAVEKLKELGKAAYSRHGGFEPYGRDAEVTRLLDQGTPVDEILAAAPKLPVEHRRQVFHSLANRLVAAGEVGRANQVIRENFADDALTNAQESLNWYYVRQLIGQGKYAEAEVIINEFPEGNRFSALISMANSVYQRSPEENKTHALGILAKAAAGVQSVPETSTEMQQSIQLIGAYAEIEPAEAFRIFDSLIPQINQLAEASVVINGFQGNYNFRRGEMLISNGNSFGVYIDASMLWKLAQKDFERTNAMIGTLSRREMRIGIRQQLLESL